MGIQDAQINDGVGQTPANATASTTSSALVAANSSRRWVFLTNIGESDVFLSASTTALVNKGILLGRDGGSLMLDADCFTKDAINGITSTGTATVIYQEGNNA